VSPPEWYPGWLLLCILRPPVSGYVKDPAGNPVMPPGMKEHWKADMDRTIDDF
jgi:hypothetical protein